MSATQDEVMNIRKQVDNTLIIRFVEDTFVVTFLLLSTNNRNQNMPGPPM